MSNGTTLHRTCSSSENSTAQRKFTWSAWCKFAGNWQSEYGGFFACVVDSSNHTSMKRDGNKKLNFNISTSGGNYFCTTNAKFMDTSSWYHIMVVYDSTEASAVDRAKIIVNGEVMTQSDTWNGTQNLSSTMGTSSSTMRIGAYGTNTASDYMYSGNMTHVVCTIGYALAATVFGETDSTTGEWKPRSAPSSITYSGNGYFLKFENSGSLGVDSSGQSNTFTVSTGGTTNVYEQSTDTPQNSFCTLNPLYKNSTSSTVGRGGLYFVNTAGWSSLAGTMPLENGKWYWEIKFTRIANWTQSGIVSESLANEIHSSHIGGISTTAFGYGISINTGSGDIYINGSSGQAWFGAGISQGVTVGYALDLQNNKMYWSSNGTWGNSSNPATNTNGYAFSGFGKPILPAHGTNNCDSEVNFGCPTHTISSANADAAGYGSFEYAVPSGFYAICTKNLEAYG